MIERSNSLKAVRLGLSIGIFLVVLYLGCLALALIFPDRGLHQPWLQFLAGFSWTLPGILLGLVEAFFYGFVSGIIFAPIYKSSTPKALEVDDLRRRLQMVELWTR